MVNANNNKDMQLTTSIIQCLFL